jgi:hypothetical protein
LQEQVAESLEMDFWKDPVSGDQTWQKLEAVPDMPATTNQKQ